MTTPITPKAPIFNQITAFEHAILPSLLEFEQKYRDVSFEDKVDLLHGPLKMMANYENFRKALRLFKDNFISVGSYYNHEKTVTFEDENLTLVVVRFSHDGRDIFKQYTFKLDQERNQHHVHFEFENGAQRI